MCAKVCGKSARVCVVLLQSAQRPQLRGSSSPPKSHRSPTDVPPALDFVRDVDRVPDDVAAALLKYWREPSVSHCDKAQAAILSHAGPLCTDVVTHLLNVFRGFDVSAPDAVLVFQLLGKLCRGSNSAFQHVIGKLDVVFGKDMPPTASDAFIDLALFCCNNSRRFTAKMFTREARHELVNLLDSSAANLSSLCAQINNAASTGYLSELPPYQRSLRKAFLSFTAQRVDPGAVSKFVTVSVQFSNDDGEGMRKSFHDYLVRELISAPVTAVDARVYALRVAHNVFLEARFTFSDVIQWTTLISGPVYAQIQPEVDTFRADFSLYNSKRLLRRLGDNLICISS
jgi:hypothetical protein